jgi:hypothetical protein
MQFIFVMRTAEEAKWMDTETSSVIETYSEVSRFSYRQKPDTRVIWMAAKTGYRSF